MSYPQFDQLLQAYPEVHRKDFVTFGILQEQPHRGSCREWAGVMSHMVGGKLTLVNELWAIVNQIQRLGCDDPMRVTEERALVDVLLRERRRSAGPLGDGAFSQLAAPGGPLARPAQPGTSGPKRDPRCCPPPPPSTPGPPPGPFGAQVGPGRPISP